MRRAQGREVTDAAAHGARCRCSDVGPIDRTRRALERDGRQTSRVTCVQGVHAPNVLAVGINAASKLRRAQGREVTDAAAHGARSKHVCRTDRGSLAIEHDGTCRHEARPHGARARNVLALGINGAIKSNCAIRRRPAQGREATPGAADAAHCRDVGACGHVARCMEAARTDPAHLAIERDGRTYRHVVRVRNVLAVGINAASKLRRAQGREVTAAAADVARYSEAAPSDPAQLAIERDGRTYRHVARYSQAVSGSINGYVTCRGACGRTPIIHKYIRLRLGGADGQSNHAH